MPKQLSHRWWIPERQTFIPVPEQALDDVGFDRDNSSAELEQRNATFDPFFGRLDLLKTGKTGRYVRQREDAKLRRRGTRRDKRG
jgi:hypothetical protein